MLLLRFKELEKAARRPPQKTYRLFKIIEYTVLLKEATIMKKETEVIRVAAYCRVSTDKLDQANSPRVDRQARPGEFTRKSAAIF